MADTSKRIIYPNDQGGVSVVVPSPESALSINEIALKDVPQGKPFKIVNVDDVPSDRTFRGAWEVEITSPDGFGIGSDAWFNSGRS